MRLDLLLTDSSETDPPQLYVHEEVLMAFPIRFMTSTLVKSTFQDSNITCIHRYVQ